MSMTDPIADFLTRIRNAQNETKTIRSHTKLKVASVGFRCVKKVRATLEVMKLKKMCQVQIVLR